MNYGKIEQPQNLLIEVLKSHIIPLAKRAKEIEAIGIFGSLARGDFHSKSDIDIFIVTKDRYYKKGVESKWYHKISEILGDLDRDITLLLYTNESLRSVSNWYALRLASEGLLLYDKRGRIKELFKEIINAAKASGLEEIESNGRKVWKKKIRVGELFNVEVSK